MPINIIITIKQELESIVIIQAVQLQLLMCLIINNGQLIQLLKILKYCQAMQLKQQYLKIIKQLINKIWVLSTENGYSYSQIQSHISCILVQQLSDHQPVCSSFYQLENGLFRALQVNYRHVESFLIKIIQILEVQLSNLTESTPHDAHDAPIKRQSKFVDKPTISQKNVQNLQVEFIPNPEINEQNLFEKIFNQKKRQDRQQCVENYSQPSYQGVEFQNLVKIYEQMSNLNAQKSKYQFKQMIEQKEMEAAILDRLLWDRQY